MSLLIHNKINILILALSIFFISCSSENIASSLKTFVAQYYTFQQNKMWSDTYEMRMPAFKKIVEKKYYIEKMTKDDSGWKLNNFKIIDSDKSSGRVILKIAFQFTLTGTDESKELELVENTIWENINGQWYAYNAGHQYHLPLNDSIVRERIRGQNKGSTE